MTIRKTPSRREREILDVLYRLGEANVEEVRREIVGNPHYSTVRAILRVLEEKGHIWHKEDNLRYVYMPSIPKHEAADRALSDVLKTFFDDSPEQLLQYLLSQMSSDELIFSRCAVETARPRLRAGRKGANDSPSRPEFPNQSVTDVPGP
jgi:predicted transcriptional regulator